MDQRELYRRDSFQWACHRAVLGLLIYIPSCDGVENGGVSHCPNVNPHTDAGRKAPEVKLNEFPHRRLFCGMVDIFILTKLFGSAICICNPIHCVKEKVILCTPECLPGISVIGFLCRTIFVRI